MQIVAHLALSWFAAESTGLDSVRERRTVALAGIAPDVDAITYPVAYVAFGFDLDRAYSEVWEVVHHRYTHGIGFALLTVAVAWWVTRRSDRAWIVALLAGLVSLAHVFCDVVGAGPTWPVYPLWPFTDAAWGVPWSWNVSDWQNGAMTLVGLVATLVYARTVGRSPVEALSPRLDAWMVDVLHGRAAPPSRRARTTVYGVLALVVLVVVLPLALGIV